MCIRLNARHEPERRLSSWPRTSVQLNGWQRCPYKPNPLSLTCDRRAQQAVVSMGWGEKGSGHRASTLVPQRTETNSAGDGYDAPRRQPDHPSVRPTGWTKPLSAWMEGETLPGGGGVVVGPIWPARHQRTPQGRSCAGVIFPTRHD